MLKHLSYSVTFATTGRTLAENIDFEKGFGTITGPNEAGKSFVLEMVRYCLFGSSALRGRRDDYKKFRAELEFSPRGELYKVVRQGANAKLFHENEEVATGTKPVNLKIVEILGFGLEVFDVACAANQGLLEKLGDMLPSERKRMVDSVIGLGAIEDLAKWAGEEANTLNREVEALKRGTIEPVAPIKPDNYRPPAIIQKEVSELGALQSELDQVRGWFSGSAPSAPKKPTCDVQLPSDNLQTFVDKQAGQRGELKALESRLAGLPDASPYPDEKLDEMEAGYEAYTRWVERQDFLKRHPQPMHSMAELQGFHDIWAAIDVKRERDRVLKQLDHALSHGENECPACAHTWPVEADQVLTLKGKLAELPEVDPPAAPPLSSDQIDVQLRRHSDWAGIQEEWAEFKDVVEVALPSITRRQINQWRQANTAAAERTDLIQQIAKLQTKLDAQPDYDAMYRKRLAFEFAVKSFHEDQAAFDAYQVEARDKNKRRIELEEEVKDLPILNEALVLAQRYEALLENYTTFKRTFDAATAEIEVLSQKAENWRKARAALLRLRGLVKQHLLPSLNKVASHLLKGMTAGARQTIVVDEDFDVMVDDQPLNTLSGSGKHVANLALRLGLGQVLTNNVLSVFVGDEIDAFMDKERSENTANTLMTLKNRISQILLITHKSPEADFYIALGKNSEQYQQAS